MPAPRNPHSDNSHTYFVQDNSNRTNKDEFARLQLQGQMLTTSMGGVLPEQTDISTFQHVLDIGCGTGDWLIATAETTPVPTRLLGVDINKKIIEYAQGETQAHKLDTRVQFQEMDVLRKLEFADDSFDLVNMRLNQSFVRTWEWGKLLRECHRVLRPGGTIRLTEAETVSLSSSAAVVQLGQIFAQALHGAGNYFTPDSEGITLHLTRLLGVALFREVQTCPYALECRAGTLAGERFAQDVKYLFRTGLPFFQKWTRIPENYEEIYQQALRDMQKPDFVATWKLLTAWGKGR